MNQIKNVLLLGYGYWGRNVARAFRESGCNVTIFEPVPSARDAAHNAGYDLFEGKGDQEYRAFEAAAICTPPDQHADLVREFLDRDMHVWTEKPIALTSEATASLIALARRKKRKLFVDHTFTFAPAVQVLSDALPHNQEDMHVEIARTHLVAPREGIDVIGDLLPHDISILQEIGLVPKRISAQKRELDALVILDFGEGDTGTIYYSWACSLKQRRMTFYGYDRTVIYDHLSPWAPIKIYTRGSSSGRDSWTHGPVMCPPVSAQEPLAAAVRSFLRDPNDNADAALKVQRVVDAAYGSLDMNDWYQVDLQDSGTDSSNVSP